MPVVIFLQQGVESFDELGEGVVGEVVEQMCEERSQLS